MKTRVDTKSKGGISLHFGREIGWGYRRNETNNAFLVDDRCGVGGGGGFTCIHVVGPRTGLRGAGSRRASRVENIICGAFQLTVI